jgi:hypothetical protein
MDIDSDNWSSAPGNGLAVSPDNIHMFWDAPGIWDGQQSRGLYGYNVAAALCVGVFNEPICTLVPSTGIAEISGLVRYKGRPVIGAYVSAGCETQITTGITTGNGYNLQVRSGGQYKLVARYDDPTTGLTLYGEATTGGAMDQPVQPNTKLWREITLIEPPDCMREVVVQGVISCDDVSVGGTDTQAKSFRQCLYVQYGVAVYEIATGAWKVDDTAGSERRTDHTVWSFSVGDANAEWHIDVQVNPDQVDPKLSPTTAATVKVTVEGIINGGESQVGPSVFNIAKDTKIGLTDTFVDTGGAFPDRANFRGMTIANNGVSAI